MDEDPTEKWLDTSTESVDDVAFRLLRKAGEFIGMLENPRWPAREMLAVFAIAVGSVLQDSELDQDDDEISSLLETFTTIGIKVTAGLENLGFGKGRDDAVEASEGPADE